jgi:hypothetical protein
MYSERFKRTGFYRITELILKKSTTTSFVALSLYLYGKERSCHEENQYPAVTL